MAAAGFFYFSVGRKIRGARTRRAADACLEDMTETCS
jgi:hypothetical protein